MATDTGRMHPRDQFWDGKRKPFIIGVLFAFLLLQILFLGNMSYLYGVVFRSSYRVHNIHMLEVNLDTGSSVIQGSVEAAYEALHSDEFPTLITKSASDYPSLQAAQRAVCRGDYWAAVVVQDGAASRLSDALAGGEAANTYNSSDALTLIVNSARYPSVALGDVIGNLDTLVGAASAAYGLVDTGAIQSLNTSSLAAVNAFRSPISSSTVNIMTTNQGPRVLYNTVSIVMPIVQQFFFLMALNGISTSYKLFSSLRISHAMGMRVLLSITYTFISSLSMTGYIWAFREDWGVDGSQFALTWMVLWLYMGINFAVLDTATGFIPMSFVPFFMLTWIILNISSSLFPFAITPGFYRWGYFFPAVHTYQLLIDIWTGGCDPVVYRALPILFAWAIVGIGLAVFAMYRRCSVAAKAEAEEEATFQKRVQESQESFSRSFSQGGSSARLAPGETVGIGQGRSENAEEYIAMTPYPERTTQNIAPMGVRMPFADTVEGLMKS